MRAGSARTQVSMAADAASVEVAQPPIPRDSPLAPFANEVYEEEDHSLAGAVPSTAVIEALVAEHGSPLFIMSTDAAWGQYQALQAALPRAKLHYAVKSLPQIDLCRALAERGAMFDLATTGEVEMMKELGVDPSRTIHTHPIKRKKDVEAALEYGCTTFVVDNFNEIEKMAAFKEDAEVMLRLSFRSMEATIDLSYKFGAQPHEAMGMLRALRESGVPTRGLCFHTGSNAALPTKSVEAIRVCRQLFDMAAAEGIALRTLDIGGGFPVPDVGAVLPIDTYCEPVVEALDELFPNTEILAEPGRFVAAPAMTLVTSVMGKSTRSGMHWYYLDDGLYGSFSSQVFDHRTDTIIPLKALRAAERGETTLQSYLVGSGAGIDARHAIESFPSVLAGPTCDSFDTIREGVLLPDLNVGDLLVSPMMGAYTLASASDFNFFYKTKVVQWSP